MEAFMYKHHPQWVLVKDMIRTGNVGSVTYIHTSFSYNNTSPSNIRNIKELGCGGRMEIGWYAISVPRFILDKEPGRVVSMMTYSADFNTDIISSALLDFGSSRATFSVATASHPFQKVDIIGTAGSITIDLPFNAYTDVPVKVTVASGNGIREILVGPADQYGLMMGSFANTVLNKKVLPVPVDDAILNQKVIDAIILSSESNSWESVE